MMSMDQEPGLSGILLHIIGKTLFSSSIITSASELPNIRMLGDRFAKLAILTADDYSAIIEFATKELQRDLGNLEIITFEECMERRVPRFRTILVSADPSMDELKAICLLLEISLDMGTVNLICTSAVLSKFKHNLESYSWNIVLTDQNWNLILLKDITQSPRNDDGDSIEDEDRLIWGND